MKGKSSRRDFLTAGLSLPIAGVASSMRLPARSERSSIKLEYRALGKTGLKVTTVGFGCMVTTSGSVIERAADLGINHFDTAREYQNGNNERMVGAALKRKRKEIVLASKTDGRDKQAALKELDTSLRELGTDYLDIWYLHEKDHPDQVPDDLVEALQVAKQQGKVRFIGVSTHGGQAQLIPWMVTKGAFDVVLTSYNFSMGAGLDPLLEQASNAGMGVVAMKVMAGGFRTPNPNSPTQQRLGRGGGMLGALKWTLKNPHVHTTIPSMTSLSQLDENIRAMAEAYTEAEEKLLARQLEYITPLYCRMCGKCEGTCAKGLPVEDILRFLAYADGYGQFSLGRERFKKLSAELSQVRCRECLTCTVSCPFGVQVTSRLSRAQELFA